MSRLPRELIHTVKTLLLVLTVEPPPGLDGTWSTSRGRLGPMDEVAISGDSIRLGQLLKLTNLVDTGGDAKSVLASGQVSVNGTPETRRGRRLVSGDVVAFGELSVRIS